MKAPGVSRIRQVTPELLDDFVERFGAVHFSKG